MDGQTKSKAMFRVSRNTLLMWCILVSAFTALAVWLLRDFPYQHLTVVEISILSLVGIFILPLWLLAASAPVIMTKSYVSLMEDGIAQYIPGGIDRLKWKLRWDDIEDWSYLETAVTQDGSAIWQPHIFLLSEGKVMETHAWLVGAKEAAQISTELRYRWGAPKDLNKPLIPVYWLGKPKWRYPIL